jgi:hypothetical protein
MDTEATLMHQQRIDTLEIQAKITHDRMISAIVRACAKLGLAFELDEFGIRVKATKAQNGTQGVATVPPEGEDHGCRPGAYKVLPVAMDVEDKIQNTQDGEHDVLDINRGNAPLRPVPASRKVKKPRDRKDGLHRQLLDRVIAVLLSDQIEVQEFMGSVAPDINATNFSHWVSTGKIPGARLENVKAFLGAHENSSA